MENKFRILWLDDEFENEQSLNIPLPIIRMRYPELDIEPVAYVDKCEEIIKNRSNDFQAIILDANGKNSKTPNQEPNKIGFEDLIDQIKALNANIPVYVFSGELSPKEVGDQADITKHRLEHTHGFVRGVNLFLKADTYPVLLNKIKNDLESGFAVFYKYPELLENVVKYGVNCDCCKNLLLWINDKKNNAFPPYVDLRRIIFDEAYEGKLKSFFGIAKIEYIDKEEITDKCMADWEKDIILTLFKNLINSNIHPWPLENPYMQEVISYSFLIAMQWFNRFMHAIELNKNVSDYYTKTPYAQPSNEENENKNSQTTKSVDVKEGIIERDNNGFYHVGPYLLKTDWASKHVGKKVRVVGDYYYKGYKKLAYKTEFID
jgi:hypothetical protein